jgi:outer membrane lipoprotein-sorting protein
MRNSLLLILLLLPPTLFAETAEERGLAIAIEVDRRDTGFDNFEASMEMKLRNKHGEESNRHMRTKALEVEGDGDKTLIIFNRPRDVKGTAMLTFSHKTGQDDQWLYLPALKRVKRISSRNKSGPFMGSEFAYEDLSSQEVEKYSYKFLREEQLDGVDMLVSERDPVDPHSGYTYQVTWIDKAEYRPFKIDFYDRKKTLMKTLTFSGYQQYLGQYWRADTMSMINHQTGKSTILSWKDYKFRTGLKASDFTRNSLKRAK